MTAEEEQRFDAFAAAIMAAYHAERGEPVMAWTGDERVGECTRAKFRRAAETVLDGVEWVRIGLAAKGADGETR